MLCCYLKYKKNKQKNLKQKPDIIKTKSRRVIVSSNSAVCSSKQSRFLKEQEANILLIYL